MASSCWVVKMLHVQAIQLPRCGDTLMTGCNDREFRFVTAGFVTINAQQGKKNKSMCCVTFRRVRSCLPLEQKHSREVEGACYPSDPAVLASGSLPPAGQGARPSFLQTLQPSVSRCVAGAEEPLPGIDIKLLGLEMIAEVLARAPVWHSLPPALNRLLRENDCSVPK